MPRPGPAIKPGYDISVDNCRAKPEILSWLAGGVAFEIGTSRNLAVLIEESPARPFDAVLLDSGTPEQPGGTGKNI